MAPSRPRVDCGKYDSLRRGSTVDNALGRLYRTCYIGVSLYIFGFLILGVALQNHLSVGALVIGWGVAVVAVMVNTVAVCASFSMPASEERLKVSST